MVSVASYSALVLGMATSCFTSSSGVCPVDFTDTRAETGTCLFFSDTQKNWYSARYDCVRRGGELVRVTSKAVVNASYVNMASKGNEIYWIGLNDIIMEGDYRWPHGDPLTWSYWGRYGTYQQPNDDSRAQNCHMCDIRLNMTPKNSWQDRECSDDYAYICEYFPDEDRAMHAGNFRLRTDTSSPDNMEITSTLACSHRYQCAAACLLEDICDGFAFNTALSKCFFLELKENSASERNSVRSAIGVSKVFIRIG
ncbi:lectin BRA-3-like [Haliotis cracherodii]|uniref:lectin BRA-3-like n=1 Tax=Haliotis cracherodii TaxID=6455 RepID=UPI0039ECBDC2